MKPIIAITAATDSNKYNVHKAYCGAVKAAGGIPVILPYQNPDEEKDGILQVLSLAHGLILTGGGDIHSKFFNEPLHPKADYISEERDAFELALCNMALEADIPLLCVCRGMQVLNVALGGGLHQDIENHSLGNKRNELVHHISITPDTLLHRILNKTDISVNSLHHQALFYLGEGLIPNAVADDGVLEAVELPNKTFTLALQWHPEALYAEYPDNLAPFQALLKAARHKFKL